MSTNILGIPNLSLRQIKAALHVARYRNLTKAAAELNRSQTAITKAVNNLEEQLGVELFERSTTGMIATAYGEALCERIEQAEHEFILAGEAYMKIKPDGRHYRKIALFTMDISYKRLASFIALYDTKGIAAAANKLDITRAAIYNSVRQLEDLLEIPLFQREPNGLAPTPYCAELARHIKLAFAALRNAIEDIAEVTGVTSGKLLVGTLPYTRTIVTPRAINRLQSDYPNVEISTRDGPYEVLESLLRSGDIDIIVGALRDNHLNPTLKTEALFEDSISLVVRKSHPLLDQAADKNSITLEDLVDYGWVLPANNSPAREAFEEIVQSNNLPAPKNTVVTSSFSTARGLLMESDRIALLSEHQIYYDRKFGLLEVLPLELNNSRRPIGFTIRAQAKPSKATTLFIDTLRSVSADIVSKL